MPRRFTVKLSALLVAFACVAAALASPAFAINPSFTWTGQSTSNGNWSNNNNWSPTTAPAPSTVAQTFDFPALPSCNQAASACYNSNNDVTGLSANVLRVDLTGAYDIAGTQPLTLTGGLTTVGSGGSATLTLPLEASGPNLWSITGDLTVSGTITTADPTKAFSIDMADSAAALRLSADDEVGDVTAAPPGPNGNSGVDAPANGTITLSGLGQLNGSDNQSVALDQVALAGAGTVGALTSNGGELQVGNGGPIGTPGKLIVAGTGLTLDANSATVFTLKSGTASPTPGTDFGQLNPTSSAALDGAVEILLNHFSCPTLQVGAVYTLVQTGGTITGHFSNAPNGAVITTPNPTGCGAGASFRINYTTSTVTATVVSAGTPPTGSTSGAPVNQTPPVATGLPLLRQVASASTGTWGGTTPMHFSFQWQRCSPTCSNISGQLGPMYMLKKADIDAKVRVIVTATNAAGSASMASNQIGPVTVTAAAIKQLLLGEITPRGKAASIRRILAAGGSRLNFSAPEAGAIKVNWFFLPPGVHISANRKPILVATGKLTFGGPGAGKLKLRLTRAGRRLLRHSHRLKLTSKGTFTPSGQGPISVTKRFKLRP
jgi:hypothetical protein